MVPFKPAVQGILEIEALGSGDYYCILRPPRAEEVSFKNNKALLRLQDEPAQLFVVSRYHKSVEVEAYKW